MLRSAFKSVVLFATVGVILATQQAQAGMFHRGGSSGGSSGGSWGSSGGSWGSSGGSWGSSGGSWVSSGGSWGSSGAGAAKGPDGIDERKVPAADESTQNIQSNQSSSVQRSSFRLTNSTRKDGSAAFQKGLTALRQETTKQALRAFEMAATAEPDNALYQYHRALATFELAGADAAQGALQKAVELESKEPIKNWGKRMERMQGRGRVWIETARRDAGLAH